MTNAPKRPGTVILLYFLQAFLGIGAIAGGFGLLSDPSGENIGLPVSLLERSPFDDYLIPGILLLVVFGLLPLIVLYGLVKKPEWPMSFGPFKAQHGAWTLSLYLGFGQIIWIMVQTYMMDSVAVIHVAYMCLGLLIQAVTLLPSVQRYFVLDGKEERR